MTSSSSSEFTKISGISFFCPAYHDEGNIERVITKAVDLFDRIAQDYEIVIVEDGSPDRTGEVADALSARYPKVRAIHHKVNRGYGEALRTGFAEAQKFEWVCFTDGDDQYDVRDLQKMIPFLATHDAVIAYREENANSWIRIVISVVYNIIVRTLFGVSFKDISCSLKIFRRSQIDRVRITSVSPFIDAEIVLKLHRLGCRIAEVGIQSHPRLYGKSTALHPLSFAKTIRDMLALFCRVRLTRRSQWEVT
jgi:glycosyltransferase involved in cell wall biosynthesis